MPRVRGMMEYPDWSGHGREPGHNSNLGSVTQDVTRGRLLPAGPLRQAQLPLRPWEGPPGLLPLLAGGWPAPQALRPKSRAGGGPGRLRGPPAAAPGAGRRLAAVAATG